MRVCRREGKGEGKEIKRRAEAARHTRENEPRAIKTINVPWGVRDRRPKSHVCGVLTAPTVVESAEIAAVTAVEIRLYRPIPPDSSRRPQTQWKRRRRRRRRRRPRLLIKIVPGDARVCDDDERTGGDALRRGKRNALNGRLKTRTGDRHFSRATRRIVTSSIAVVPDTDATNIFFPFLYRFRLNEMKTL